MIFETYDLFGFDRGARSSSAAPGEVRRATTRSGTGRGGPDTRHSAKLGVPYTIDPGDGAFYGPKIDFKRPRCAAPRVAARHRPARLPLPERFGLEYVASRRHAQPAGHDPPRACSDPRAVLRRATSSTGRAFPLWLAPVQARIMPITAPHHAWAERSRRAAARGCGSNRSAQREARAQDPRGHAAARADDAGPRRQRGRGQGRRAAESGWRERSARVARRVREAARRGDPDPGLARQVGSFDVKDSPLRVMDGS